MSSTSAMQLLTEIDDFERQVWQNASGSAAKLRFAQACVEDVDFAAARDLVDGCSSNSPPASGSKLPEPVYHRRLRHRQKPGWRVRSATTPRAPSSRFSINGCRGVSPTSRSPRGDDRYPRPIRSPCRTRLSILDDWGAGTHDRRAAPGPARDRRGSLRPRLDPAPKPAADQPLARRRRRADPRRRHSRSHRAPRPAHRAQGCAPPRQRAEGHAPARARPPL